MSIELLNKDHLSTLDKSIGNAEKSIFIVSPFIGYKTSEHLAKALKDSENQCTIITRFYREDFINNASSLEGLKLLINAGVTIYCLKDLHTKLFIFDEEMAIIGSANFTMGGFRYNHELSLFIEDEHELICQLNDYFHELVKNIIASGDWKLTLSKVEEEIEADNALIKERNNKLINYKNSYTFGADIKKQSEVKLVDEIEAVFVEKSTASFDNEIWLKFVGTGDDRFDSDIKYIPTDINDIGDFITSFPRKPTGIADNDYIYIAALSKDKNGTHTPMIVARARTYGYESGNIASDEDMRRYSWMTEYPYYIRLFDYEILDTQIKNCISLDKLIRTVQSNLYPSTQNKQISIPELKTRHYQKSHLKITPTAKEHIDRLFGELEVEYGIIKY